MTVFADLTTAELAAFATWLAMALGSLVLLTMTGGILLDDLSVEDQSA